MARPGWLNDNVNRTYPFIKDRAGAIPDCAVADFGSTALANSGYVEGEHEVWLEWIRRIGPVIEFSFRSDAPELVDKSLIFQRDVTDTGYITSFTYAQLALNQSQLDAACECEDNVVCNPFFDETESEESSSEALDEGEFSSSSLSDSFTGNPCLDKYPGSAVYGWDVTAGVTQAGGVLRMEIASLGIESATQIIEDFVAGQTIRLFVDVVSSDGNAASFVVIRLSGPGENDVLEQTTATLPGLYAVTVAVPAGGTVYIKIIVFNASATSSMLVELDNVSLQYCISNSSSYAQGEPDPEICPVDSLWEGFLVTGDIPCLLEYLEDCTRAGGVIGGDGDADVLFLTDTTGSMGGYIATVKAVFAPLATSVAAILPGVSFLWAAASYKDFEDGGDYAAGIKLDQTFTSSISTVQAAIDGWSASGGGDSEEQQLASLKIAAETWTGTFGGRAGSQKIIIWGGDVAGWEDAAKGNPYPSLQAAISALLATGVKVFAINPQAGGSGIDGVAPSPTSGRNQASAICNETGGLLSNSVAQTDTDAVAAAVANGIVTSVGSPPEVISSQLDGPAYVEPSRTKNLDGSYVRSISLVNADRTRATSPSGCRDYCWPFDIEEHYVRCECVAGNVSFLGGCNASIRIDIGQNALIIDGDLDSGGESCGCENPAITLAEAPPVGRTTLDGAPDCNEVVRSINGVGGRFLKILGGRGVIVTDIPEQNRVIVDVGLHNLALCPELPADELVDCIPPSSDDCDCGPAEGEPFNCPDGATTPPPEETTSTTAGPNECGGPCTWQWVHPVGEDPEWVQILGTCEEDCACAEPSSAGELTDETRDTSCLSIFPECRLVNHDFAVASYGSVTGEITDLPGWVIAGDAPKAYYQPAGGKFAFDPILNQGSVVRLDASGSNTTIRQQFPVIAGRQYLITAYVNTIQGRSEWGLTATDGVTVLEPDSESFLPALGDDPGQYELRVYTAPLTGNMRIFFTADNSLTFTGRGLYDVAHACIEEL